VERADEEPVRGHDVRGGARNRGAVVLAQVAPRPVLLPVEPLAHALEVRGDLG
jgi:hypothetical protein